MALKQTIFNIAAFNDSEAGGNNYFAGTVFEVYNTNDTLADIFSDAAGANPINQDGIENVSDSSGRCNFYVEDGSYYIKVGANREEFTVGNSSDLISDLSQAYEFPTVAAYKAFIAEFPLGKVINLLDRSAKFLVIAGTGAGNDKDIIASDNVSQSIALDKTLSTYSDQWGLGGTPPANLLSLIGNLRYSAILAGRNNVINMGAGAIGLGDGATICGGNDNQILAAFDNDCQGAFIGGGWQNRADGYWVTIAGGKGNEINADIVNYSFIGGGNTNLINGTQAFLSVIVGGRDNVISGDTANRCFIGGGGENTITGTATSRAVLVGGELNQITGDNAFYTFLGGGQSNQITGQSSGHSVLIGGKSNQIIGSNTVYAFIGGGESNSISASTGQHSVIVGGRENDIQSNAQYSVIVGGFQNLMNGQRSFIGSGFANNIATASGTQNAIVGGTANAMLSTTVQNSFVGGGSGNEIGIASDGTVLIGVSILGGEDNISIGSRSSILGGLGLRADSYLEVVKGTYNDPSNPDGIGSPSKTTYVAGQVAESLGIGTSDAARANAYVWLKNGKQIRYNTPVYADNAAALAGGELVGTVYRTATGQLMEVFQ